MKNNVKTIVNVPEWAEYFNQNGGATDEISAYSQVPLVYRCARMIADSLSSVPLVAKQGDKVVPFPFDMDVSAWVWKTAISILLTGASYSIKLTPKMGRGAIGLQWLNPTTVTPYAENTPDGVQVKFRRSGNVMGGQKSTWDQNEMLYIKEFNPVDDVLPGPHPALVSITDAGTIRYLTRFASYYFQKGAMPLTIISVAQGTPDNEVKRVEGAFKQLATGISNAWRMMVLKGGKEIAPFTVTPPLGQLAMPELLDQSRRAIAAAFGIPQTMIEDAANYATAKEHRLSYWQDTVRPRGVQITGAMNEQVGKQMGYTFEFAFEEMDIFQEDEADRAASLSALTSAGVPLLAAMDILGYDLTPEQQSTIAAKPEIPAPVQETSTGMIPKIMPIDDQAIRSALHHWKTAYTAAMKSGKTDTFYFDNPDIPDTWVREIALRLQTCQNEDEIKSVFAQANEWRIHAKAAEGY